MHVTRDMAAEDAFYERMEHYLAARDRVRVKQVYHVSDLLSPRKTYFKVRRPLPPTRAEIGYFLSGRSMHEPAEAVMAGPQGEREKQVAWKLEDGLTILGTMDAFETVPHEFKTSRRWQIPGSPESHYIEQLACYCALTGSNIGRLVVFYLTPGRTFGGEEQTKPTFVVWTITFTEEELEETRRWLAGQARSLEAAFARDDPSALPLCEAWLCKTRKKGRGYVQQCPYFEECKPEGRWPLEKAVAGR